MYERFADRRAAGRELARCLRGYGDRADAVVLGLPRGGIPVAYEVARALAAALAGAADEVMCATTPEPFVAVGVWYRDFSPTADEEVRLLLERSAEHATDAG